MNIVPDAVCNLKGGLAWGKLRAHPQLLLELLVEATTKPVELPRLQRLVLLGVDLALLAGSPVQPLPLPGLDAIKPLVQVLLRVELQVVELGHHWELRRAFELELVREN